MTNLRNLMVLATSLVALAACTNNAPPAANAAANAAADAKAVKAVNIAWYKAFSSGDGAAVAALYAEDAVLDAPGVPAARGRAAISDYFVKELAANAAAGVTSTDGPTSDVGVSGDLGWQSGTYAISDKSGAVVEAGKYLTVLQRKDGKWMIIRDTWNADGASAAAAASASAAASK
jgi:uncharacterized protein (TIGR02246 family)